MPKTLIKNIGMLFSGDIERPLFSEDALLIENGKIAEIGAGAELESESPDKVIDVHGSSVAPGLIDSHAHVVFGDFTPRQNQIGFLESSVHGGVTTFISAGEVHLPGRPKDASGTKALAILAAKCYSNFRPGGAKVIGGAVILEKGLKENDFQEMAGEGVRVVGEIGLGSIKTPHDASQMVGWAKNNQMIVLMHTGGTNDPLHQIVDADQIIAVNPDVACHVNGGPTSLAFAEIEKLVKQTDIAIENGYSGNTKTFVDALQLGKEHRALHRFILGSDSPSGTGVIPLALLRMLSTACAFAEIPPETAICMATGNTAKVFGLHTGMIRKGLWADVIAFDAPMGSVGKNGYEALQVGDVPGISMVMIEGKVRIWNSRNTPPARKKAEPV